MSVKFGLIGAMYPPMEAALESIPRAEALGLGVHRLPRSDHVDQSARDAQGTGLGQRPGRSDELLLGHVLRVDGDVRRRGRC